MSVIAKNGLHSLLAGFFRFERAFPCYRKFLWRTVYGFLAWRLALPEWTFMNYGFAPTEGDPEVLSLADAQAPERYAIQLYHQLIDGVCLEGREIAEIGCGRGGGSAWIAKSQKVKSIVGVDLSKQAINFCRANHQLDNLGFVQGDAEDIPFSDSSLDAVVNLESSHHYPSMSGFVSEVWRVLKPGGYFLFADYRNVAEIQALQELLQGSGFIIRVKRDITDNVIHALALDNQRKSNLIESRVPVWLQPFVKTFAGVDGYRVQQAFVNGKLPYLHYIMQKPAQATCSQVSRIAC